VRSYDGANRFAGVGKTSLIKAIVQTCEDIVHVDPLSSTPVVIPQTQRKSSKSKSRNGNAEMQSTLQITEVYASTRAYPAWWSDLEDIRILRRRKSMGDSVLERNLCFVDTPGYGNKTSVCITLLYFCAWLICAVSGIYYAGCRLYGVSVTEIHIHARLE
jgi:hypothetical protein